MHKLFNIVICFLLVLPETVWSGNTRNNIKKMFEDGTVVYLEKLQMSDDVKEHVYIKLEPESTLVLRYNISGFTDQFISDFICAGSVHVLQNHIFSNRNVELNIVGHSIVDIKFTGGLEMHLRGDIKNDMNYQTFKSNYVLPEIAKLNGDVFILKDTNIVVKKFPDLFLNSYRRYYPSDALSSKEDESGTTSVFKIHSDYYKTYSIPNIRGDLDMICSKK